MSKNTEVNSAPLSIYKSFISGIALWPNTHIGSSVLMMQKFLERMDTALDFYHFELTTKQISSLIRIMNTAHLRYNLPPVDTSSVEVVWSNAKKSAFGRITYNLITNGDCDGDIYGLIFPTDIFNWLDRFLKLDKLLNDEGVRSRLIGAANKQAYFLTSAEGLLLSQQYRSSIMEQGGQKSELAVIIQDKLNLVVKE